MKFTKVSALPRESKQTEAQQTITKFLHSGMKFAKIAEDVSGDKLITVYNTIYQACRRMKANVSVRRINGEIYLVRLDANGNEL